jgi:methionyl-tRNA synthetase
MIKDTKMKEHVLEVCTTAINLFFKLMIMLKPVMPNIAKNGELFLNVKNLEWQNIHDRLTNHEINDYKPLITRITSESIEAMLDK